MPLPLLLALVICGIAGIAVLLHLLGLTAPRRLDRTRARAGWLREFPDTDVTSVTLCTDGSAALVVTPHGPGVVWPMGADTTARWLSGARILPAKHGLTIHMADVTAPRLTLRLSPDEAQHWTQAIGATP